MEYSLDGGSTIILGSNDAGVVDGANSLGTGSSLTGRFEADGILGDGSNPGDAPAGVDTFIDYSFTVLGDGGEASFQVTRNNNADTFFRFDFTTNEFATGIEFNFDFDDAIVGSSFARNNLAGIFVLGADNDAVINYNVSAFDGTAFDLSSASSVYRTVTCGNY